MAGKKTYVFNENSAPFSMCHGSNAIILNDGSFLTAWFAGSHEGSDDTAIWMGRRGAEGWMGIEKIADDGPLPHWNPILYQLPNGELRLFYKTGRDIHSWVTMIRTSTDKGQTWSASEELVEGDRGGRGPVRTKVLTLSDGSLLAGGSIEKGIWHSFADRSEDGGKTWWKSEPIAISDLNYMGEKTATHSDIAVSEQSFYGRGVIQPSLWESENGQVHMLMRSSEGRIYRSDSTDYGKSWSRVYDTGLPNNNSGIDVACLQSGTLLLCYNPSGSNWGARSPLKLAVSKDNGKEWKDVKTLEQGIGEFSYPSVMQHEGNVFLTYTWNRKSIAAWQFEENELED